jgi:transposase
MAHVMIVSREQVEDKAFQAHFRSLLERLDEKERRWVAALFSKSLGRGGDSIVSSITGLSTRTISRGRHDLETRFAGCPTDRVRRIGAGRPSSLDASQLATLESLLSAGASAHGWPNDLWTIKRIGAIIERHFALQLSTETVRNILDAIEWTFKKPKQSYRETDQNQIQRWKARKFVRIKKQARERKACLAFIDESGFMLAPLARKTFAPRGRTPVNKVSDPHARISTISALVVHPDDRADLHYHLLDDNINFNARSIVSFLDQMATEISTPITVVWDSVSIHRAACVSSFLKDQSHIKCEYFPKYASELNPADAVWAYVKFNRLANYCPSRLAELRTTLIDELDRVKERQDLLFAFIRRSRLKLWPQFLPPPK